MKGVTNILGYVFVVLLAIVGGLATFGLSILALIVLVICTFAGAAKRAEKAETQLRTTLMAGEQPIAVALQHRVFALLSRRHLVAITDSRVINVQRGLLGGFKMADIQWKDLKDVTMEQNVLPGISGSNLSFAHLNPGAPHMATDGVPSDVASRIYSKAQAEEQAWEEKRRVRAMEEVRAAAGGVVVHAPSPGGPSSAAGPSRVLTEIQEAKKLLDSGTISDAEFQEMKSKILAGA